MLVETIFNFVMYESDPVDLQVVPIDKAIANTTAQGWEIDCFANVCKKMCHSFFGNFIKNCDVTMHIVTCECTHYIMKYLDKNGKFISFLHKKTYGLGRFSCVMVEQNVIK